jgi:hypothetical protein
MDVKDREHGVLLTAYLVARKPKRKRKRLESKNPFQEYTPNSSSSPIRPYLLKISPPLNSATLGIKPLPHRPLGDIQDPNYNALSNFFQKIKLKKSVSHP